MTTLVALGVVATVAVGCGGTERAQTGEPRSPAGPRRVDVTAVDFAFQGVPATVEPGETTFVLTNEGKVSHEMVFGRLVGDQSIQQIAGPGESGAVEVGSRRVISAIGPGASGTVAFDLQPGRYGYVCFLGEGTNDEPHAYHGMLGEFVVG